jgi:L-lactate dehydrogenase (cytochrome)
LKVIHKELESSMGLCGRTDVTKLDRDILMVPKGFSGDWAE